MTIASLRRQPKLGRSCAIALSRTVATHEPSPEEVSALRVGVNYRGGPSPEFIARGRNPSLEPPARFEPTTKGENDVVI